MRHSNQIIHGIARFRLLRLVRLFNGIKSVLLDDVPLLFMFFMQLLTMAEKFTFYKEFCNATGV